MAGVGDMRDSSSPSPVETPDNPDGIKDRAALEEEVSLVFGLVGGNLHNPRNIREMALVMMEGTGGFVDIQVLWPLISPSGDSSHLSCRWKEDKWCWSFYVNGHSVR